MGFYYLKNQDDTYLLQEDGFKLILDGYTFTEQTLNLSYNIQQGAEIQKTLTYTVTAANSTSKSLQYTILIPDNEITKPLSYEVVAPFSLSKSLQYAVTVAVNNNDKSLKYTVASTITATTKNLTYSILQSPTAIVKSLMYVITSTIAATTKSLSYLIVTTPTAITKSLQYKVKPSIAIFKSLKYTVVAAAPMLESNTKRLSYNIITNNEFTELYHKQNQTFSSSYSAKGTTFTYLYRRGEMHGINKSLTYVVS